MAAVASSSTSTSDAAAPQSSGFAGRYGIVIEKQSSPTDAAAPSSSSTSSTSETSIIERAEAVPPSELDILREKYLGLTLVVTGATPPSGK
jgi:hypothetical protein